MKLRRSTYRIIEYGGSGGPVSRRVNTQPTARGKKRAHTTYSNIDLRVQSPHARTVNRGKGFRILERNGKLTEMDVRRFREKSTDELHVHLLNSSIAPTPVELKRVQNEIKRVLRSKGKWYFSSDLLAFDSAAFHVYDFLPVLLSDPELRPRYVRLTPMLNVLLETSPGANEIHRLFANVNVKILSDSALSKMVGRYSNHSETAQLLIVFQKK